MATSAISCALIHQVKRMYLMSLDDALNGNSVRHGINSFAVDGIAAYIIAAASVEAFINETFLTLFPRAQFKDSPLWNMPTDWLEKVELSAKLILIPQLLFEKTFRQNEQPYQDMSLLIRIRNDMIHFKMHIKPPKYISHLSERGIALVASDFKENGADYAWPHKLSCSEGIRWANNTAYLTIQKLTEFVDSSYKESVLRTASNFVMISDSFVSDWYMRHGIDPESSYPEKTKLIK